MEDRDFFDTLYQGWTKTTGAEDTYWMPEEHPDEGFYTYDIFAVDEKQLQAHVASGLSEDDAAFITAVHGCFADLVRRLHTALDEADRWEYERDSQECRIAELVMENEDLRGQLA